MKRPVACPRLPGVGPEQIKDPEVFRLCFHHGQDGGDEGNEAVFYYRRF